MKTSRKSLWALVLALMGFGLVSFTVYALFQPIVCDRDFSDIQSLKTQLERYKSLHGVYPTTEQGLHIPGAVPKDPWSNDYAYRSPGKRYPNGYDVFSVGPDRTTDTPDDEYRE